MIELNSETMTTYANRVYPETSGYTRLWSATTLRVSMRAWYGLLHVTWGAREWRVLDD